MGAMKERFVEEQDNYLQRVEEIIYMQRTYQISDFEAVRMITRLTCAFNKLEQAYNSFVQVYCKED